MTKGNELPKETILVKDLRKRMRAVNKLLEEKHDTNEKGGSRWILNYVDVVKIEELLVAAKKLADRQRSIRESMEHIILRANRHN